ncbi:alpha-amylase family protein [Rufibacter immobilis]|uniref:alpha-amylase family protein n=1 Tax=Rufibacter immobilis TaxID=1348778 RepID=UPI001C84066B|nr:alpha-amylase family protein [Rufibacter immobilis]
MKRLYCCYFLLCALFLVSPARAQNTAHDINEELWYKNCVIYSLEVGTFRDSDGDGVGDFEGLTGQLDYLKSLGIDAIWLAPFQSSPKLDDGYDVANYYDVDPQYGSPGDFAEFMYQANKHGIRVIMDLVLNHTSDQHPWFKQAREDKNSRYRNWYVWSKERPQDWNKGMAFPGVQKETWTYDKKAGEYYFHRFYNFQPDLNFENPDVRTEAQRILGFWMNQGVSGFRLDAVPFIIDLPKTSAEKPEHMFELITEFRRFVQWRKGDALILGEANVMPDENKEYFGEQGDRMHTMFNFYANQYLFYAMATGEVQPFKKALTDTKKIPGTAQWAYFLRNHDEIDLGRLTEEQRNKVYQAFGPEKDMQLYDRGIRRRLAPMLGNDRKRLELAYSLVFSLPGTPVIRYGDEIGMGDDLQLKERIAVRTPMQWTDQKNAGFTSAHKPFRPIIDKEPFSYRQINVAIQRQDPNSLLNWTANLIRIRRECPEIGLGEWQLLEVGSPEVLAIRYDYQGKAVVMVHNFSKEARQIQLPVQSEKEKELFSLTQNNKLTATNNGYAVRLEGYGYNWFRVGSAIR